MLKSIIAIKCNYNLITKTLLNKYTTVIGNLCPFWDWWYIIVWFFGLFSCYSRYLFQKYFMFCGLDFHTDIKSYKLLLRFFKGIWFDERTINKIIHLSKGRYSQSHHYKRFLNLCSHVSVNYICLYILIKYLPLGLISYSKSYFWNISNAETHI